MSGDAARRAFAGAAAAALGVGLGQAMTFPHSHWAAMTALTLLRPGSDGTARRTLYRILGTVAGAAAVIGFYGIGDPQPRIVIPLALLLIGGVYVLMPYTGARYAFVLFAVTGGGFALDLLNEPHDAPQLVGYRVFHILSGAILVYLTTMLVGLRDPPVDETAGPPRLAESVERSLRLVLACVLCLALSALIERPSYGGSMAITVCILGARASLRESLSAGMQRLGGSVIGGVLALGYYILILDSATSVYSLMTIVFVVCWFCAYLTAIPSVSYLGFQIGLVFTWSMADTRAPAGDVFVPLDRMVQVALATALMLICARVPVRLPERWTERLTRRGRSLGRDPRFDSG